MFFNTSENQGVGPSIRNIEFNAYNRTGSAVAVGDVLMLDHLSVDGASFVNTAPTTADIGAGYVNADGGTGGSNAATWPWGNCLTPTSEGAGVVTTSAGAGTGGGGAPLVVVTSLLTGAGANDTLIRVCIDGLVNVKCLTTEPVVPGDSLSAQAAATLTSVSAVGKRIVGKAFSKKADNASNIVFAYFCGHAITGQNFAN